MQVCRFQKVHWYKCTSGGLQMQPPRPQDSLLFQPPPPPKKPKPNHHHHEKASSETTSKHNPSNHSCSCHHSQVTTAPQWQSASSQTPVHQFQVGAASDDQKLIPACAGMSETQGAAAFNLLCHWQQSTHKRNKSLLRLFPSQKKV